MSSSRRSSHSSKQPARVQVYPAESAGRPGSQSFFEKSPAANVARSIYLKTYIGGTVMMVITIFAVLSIYWGALFRTPSHNLKGWVVDFDGGLVGQSVSQALGSNQGSGKVTWEVIPASRFPGGIEDLAQALRHEDSWTAISNLQPHSRRRTPSYDGAQAITGYGVEARNENAFRVLIRPSIQGTLDAVSKAFATRIAQSVANSTAISSILTTSPQTIVSPISYTIDNLIPYDQPVATAATFVGMLYQLILGFFIVVIANAAREASGFARTLSTRSLITLRLSSSFLAYFIISLFYSLLNLAFHIDLDRKYVPYSDTVASSSSGWFNYVGMLAVALALESLITLLTPRFIPFFMLLWIIANLSVSIFPIEVLPAVYHYGYAAPFYNLSKALRTIVFGTRNRVGMSVGILLAWVAISVVTLALLQWFVRRRPAPSSAASSATNFDNSSHVQGEKAPSVKKEGNGDMTLFGRETPIQEEVDRDIPGV
ncbi:hypothetical protein FA13DRAFT_1786108 [Coprinellus micaceus]|uniref:DUF3533 domain-containing protein n=1 Tax=Coprinellus micaceus TaxID=71717 RepID=A0A4Y7TVU3_COPMI|nr:hypothetical protein FA13DRAFT_1786108 [Coprinellus micaceus]